MGRSKNGVDHEKLRRIEKRACFPARDDYFLLKRFVLGTGERSLSALCATAETRDVAEDSSCSCCKR